MNQVPSKFDFHGTWFIIIMDALQQAQKIAAAVSQGEKRKYYRFRSAPFYGGIATADCVGCCLSCIFCWSWNIVCQPEKVGKFYSPAEVSHRLVTIARRHGFRRVRISGNEPTLNRQHLISVLKLIPKHLRFILETNGILLGNDPGFCEELAQFPNLHVRVSLKGCSEADFEKLTGMDGHGFALQLEALRNLFSAGVSCHPAVMHHFSSPMAFNQLRRRLHKINPDFAEIETEQLLLYPAIQQRLQQFGFIPQE